MLSHDELMNEAYHVLNKNKQEAVDHLMENKINFEIINGMQKMIFNGDDKEPMMLHLQIIEDIVKRVSVY